MAELSREKAFFDAQPAFAQRFPGGIIEFAQIAGNLPEEALDDIMIANIGNEELNRMPGGMPDQHAVMFVDTSDEEDENIDDGAPVAVPFPAPERNGESGDDDDSDDEDITVRSSTLGYRDDFNCFYISQCQYVSSGIS